MPRRGRTEHRQAEFISFDVQFEPQGFAGFGPEIEGRFTISDMTIPISAADHMLKAQHVMMARGIGKGWLFVQYGYTRH